MFQVNEGNKRTKNINKKQIEVEGSMQLQQTLENR